MLSLGLAYAALAAVLNGSFGTLAKLPSIRAASVHPVVFNYWMVEGAAIAGLLTLAAEPRVFTPWGLASGLLFVASTANTFAAIHYLGLSVASGIWCGVAVLTSFAYGVGFAGDQLSDGSMAGAALLLLVAGIAGIAAAGHLGQSKPQGGGAAGQLYDLLPEHVQHAQAGEDAESLRERLAQREGSPPDAFSTFPLGVTAAVAAGAFGGLILAPMLAAPETSRGLPFVPSMSVGIFVAAPLVTYLLAALGGAGADPMRASHVAVAPGMAAGAVWQAGNVCSILAVQDPHVGLAVAYPLMQCGLFVAGAWGILLFREVRGWWQALYFVSGATLLAGAALLAASK